MVLHASAGHWQPRAAMRPMWPQLLPRQPRMRRRKQSALKRRKRLLKRCSDQSHETAGTQASLPPQEEGVSMVLMEVLDGRALKGLDPQVEGSKRQEADAYRQGGNDTQRAPDEPQPAVVVGRRLAHFLHLLRNRLRNLGYASTTSRIDVIASQEHRVVTVNTSTSIRLDSNRCPSRTRCLLRAPLLLAKRTYPRSLAEMEMNAIITKRENASSGMRRELQKCACLERH